MLYFIQQFGIWVHILEKMLYFVQDYNLYNNTHSHLGSKPLDGSILSLQQYARALPQGPSPANRLSVLPLRIQCPAGRRPAPTLPPPTQ